jgi:NAD+ kinase
MTKVGIIVNFAKDSKLDFTSSIINWLNNKNCDVLLPYSITEKLLLNQKNYENEFIYEKSDFILVLGGDGTMLGAARNVSKYGTPILGINMGHLGFMTDVEIKDTFQALEKVIAGKYEIEERMMLEANIISKSGDKKTLLCLNEICIAKGIMSKMLSLQININEGYFDSYHADGILIATPTGSTAYSLSAGGPIVNPMVNVLLITPICPHSLSARAIIVSENEVIGINIAEFHQDSYLTVDGQESYKINENDSIIIKKANYATKLIKVSNRSFYDVLRTKLKERFI